MTDEAIAFVPGHVTGFFSPHPSDDPAKSGSRGAGLTLTDGVDVTVRRSADPAVSLDGESIDVEPVGLVLEALGATDRVAVDVASDLPLGTGFGVSGAAALGTALAVNAVLDRRLSENELVTLAHGAEVKAGTGLGDVVAQARGGIPIRLEPGAPGHGVLDGVPSRTRVEYVAFDELPTEEVLAGDTEPISVAGRDALSLLVSNPTLPQFMYASRRFAREAGLLSARVRETIEAVGEAGGEASMAMLGETVFALGTGLTDAGYDADACEVHPAGASLTDSR